MNYFVIADPDKCIGCRTCMIGCVVAHSDEDIFYQNLDEINFNPKLSVIKTKEVSAPIQCRHCEDAPCLNSCPQKAIVKENNIMSVNEEKCIGCKTCLLACPFGAIDLLPQYEDGKEVEQVILDENKKIAYKCDLCKDNEKIACISACPQEALKLVTPIDDKKAKNRQAALSLLLTNK